jgi:hypothetical protein
MYIWQTPISLALPWLLLGTTYLSFFLLKRRYGARKAYLGGFIFYWAFWCLVIPLILMGPQQLINLFHPVSQPFGQPWLLGLLCLLGPPLVSRAFFAYHHPRAFYFRLVARSNRTVAQAAGSYSHAGKN